MNLAPDLTEAGVFAYTVACAVFAIVIDRRPAVGPNWRFLWPPAYVAWRRRYLSDHPALTELYREDVYSGPPCAACNAAADLSAEDNPPSYERHLAGIADLPCTCGRVWTPNASALARLGRGEWTDGP